MDGWRGQQMMPCLGYRQMEADSGIILSDRNTTGTRSARCSQDHVRHYCQRSLIFRAQVLDLQLLDYYPSHVMISWLAGQRGFHQFPSCWSLE
jgi:hypothetical protein